MSRRSVQIISEDDIRVLIDHHNKALVVQESIHNNVHLGLLFAGSTYDQTLADDGTLELLMQVHADQEAHLRFSGTNGGDALIELYSGTTFSIGGVPLTLFNHNRITTNIAATAISGNPTVTVAGTLLVSAILPGGQRQQSSGGSLGTADEWILKPGTNYLLRLTNISGAVKVADLRVDIYEPVE